MKTQRLTCLLWKFSKTQLIIIVIGMMDSSEKLRMKIINEDFYQRKVPQAIEAC